ncbi:MAG: S-adenosylmethionine decarboxylase [Deltaproteobacteria bacterium]|nr:S-adenosylmethionine decarboxylase [Deltaproteobacteria bacterium]
MIKKYGKELVLDLFGCSDRILSKRDIKRFVYELCDLIKMKRYKDAYVCYFGNKYSKGYSIFQFIETSSVTGHFSDEYKSAYLNIFSCKPFNSKEVAAFAKIYFNASKYKYKEINR